MQLVGVPGLGRNTVVEKLLLERRQQHETRFGVQAPETQTPPVVQSAVVVQLHAGFEPPHATHWLDTHVWPDAQSVGSVHSTVVPGVVPGATHSPDVQTVPCGQSLLAEQVCVHPWVVHSLPVGHPLVLVHGVSVGGVTALQP